MGCPKNLESAGIIAQYIANKVKRCVLLLLLQMGAVLSQIIVTTEIFVLLTVVLIKGCVLDPLTQQLENKWDEINAIPLKLQDLKELHAHFIVQFIVWVTR